MRNLNLLKKCLLAVFVGIFGGVFILGVGGRIATALIAIAAGTNLNLSLRGLLEVLFVGSLIGAVGGFLLVPVRIILPTHRLTRGIIIGVLLASGCLVIAWSRGDLNLDFHSVLPFTLAAVVIIFVLYGVAIDVLFTRFEHFD